MKRKIKEILSLSLALSIILSSSVICKAAVNNSTGSDSTNILLGEDIDQNKQTEYNAGEIANEISAEHGVDFLETTTVNTYATMASMVVVGMPRNLEIDTCQEKFSSPLVDINQDGIIDYGDLTDLNGKDGISFDDIAELVGNPDVGEDKRAVYLNKLVESDGKSGLTLGELKDTDGNGMITPQEIGSLVGIIPAQNSKDVIVRITAKGVIAHNMMIKTTLAVTDLVGIDAGNVSTIKDDSYGFEDAGEHMLGIDSRLEEYRIRIKNFKAGKVSMKVQIKIDLVERP